MEQVLPSAKGCGTSVMDFLIVLLMSVLRRRDGLLWLCAVDYLNSIGLFWKLLVYFLYISWRFILIALFLINTGLDGTVFPFCLEACSLTPLIFFNRQRLDYKVSLLLNLRPICLYWSAKLRLTLALNNSRLIMPDNQTLSQSRENICTTSTRVIITRCYFRTHHN